MAYEILGQDVTVEASADLSGSQYYICNIDSNGQLALAGAGAAGFVLQDKPDAAGKAGSIRISGLSKVSTGAAVAAGALLASDASGQAVTAVATDDIIGKALTASAGADEIITMIVAPGFLA